MTVTAALLDSWVGANVRHFCLEGLRGTRRPGEAASPYELGRRSAQNRTRRPEDLGANDWPFRLDSENQCAHFVAHVLGLMENVLIWNGTRPRVSWSMPGVSHTNVEEIAQRCRRFRQISLAIDEEGIPQCPTNETSPALIYVAPAGAIRRRGRGDNTRCTEIRGIDRHIGFYLDGRVWHYENHVLEHVVTHLLGRGQGREVFNNRYGDLCELWLSDLPIHGAPRSFSRVP